MICVVLLPILFNLVCLRLKGKKASKKNPFANLRLNIKKKLEHLR